MAKTRNTSAGSAADVMASLAALAPTTAKPKPGAKTKWEMELTNEAREMATRWISAKTVMEPVEKRVENAKAEFSDYALRLLATKLFESKVRPSNPLVVLKKADNKTVDHQFQFTLQDKFKYRFPEVPEGTDTREHFIEVFRNLGLTAKNAEALVDNELDFNPVMGIRTITELLEGRYGEGREWIDSTPEEKAAGQKLAALLMWNGDMNATPTALTPEEKAMVVERSPGMSVKAEFYNRVCNYAQNVDQLMAIFKVIIPICYPVYAKFAINDTETDKTQRKIAAAADILGTAVSTEE